MISLNRTIVQSEPRSPGTHRNHCLPPRTICQADGGLGPPQISASPSPQFTAWPPHCASWDCNYVNLQRSIKRLALDVSHWTGQGHLRGKRGLPRRKLPLAAILRRGSGYHSNKLRRRLIAEGLLTACCSGCGLELWLGQPVPLELDHVDGDRQNNELSNLRLVCPNCHALTPTYRGRNKRIRYARKSAGTEGAKSTEG